MGQRIASSVARASQALAPVALYDALPLPITRYTMVAMAIDSLCMSAWTLMPVYLLLLARAHMDVVSKIR